ncbi:MAG: FHA domain-containing protein [Chitinophagales bacterium]|nr:FHA domain-containing protein [Bacteroidota bacterium]MCB9044226.1 FHA domain-containing protein [Chitinophagales bacterium]
MKTFKLGNAKNPKNDIPIQDSSVSSEHLELWWDDKANLIIKDIGSKNGTKKNGIFIRQTDVKPNDKIEIGFNIFTGAELINKAIPFKYMGKVQFFDEFQAMKPFFEQYQKDSLKIKGTRSIKIQLFRSLIMLILLGAFYVFGTQLGIPPFFRFAISLLGGTLGFFLANKIFDEKTITDKLAILREEYSDKLKCPKCTYSLVSKDFLFWKNQRKCPKCQANWVK